MTDQASAGSVVRGAVFLRLELTDETILALWLGFGDIDVPVNDLDADGQRYQGLGALIGVPELTQLLNGVSDRVNFTLSGVPEIVAVLADLEVGLIDGAAVNLAICRMDEDWAIAGGLLWLWEGLADKLTVTFQTDPSGAQTYTIQLSVSSGSPARARPDLANWSDAQHQLAYPGDLILNNVPAPEAQKRWPGG